MSTPTAEQLGAGLTAHRQRLGLSRRALAKRAGVAVTTLRDLELGLDNPSAQRIDQLEDLLGVRILVTVETAPESRP